MVECNKDSGKMAYSMALECKSVLGEKEHSMDNGAMMKPMEKEQS